MNFKVSDLKSGIKRIVLNEEGSALKGDW